MSINALEPGDPVVIRFESHFNPDATQTVIGMVADEKITNNAYAEIAINGDDGHTYMAQWDGGVSRRNDSGDWDGYGGAVRLYRLDKINLIEDLDRDDVNEEDRPTNDPFLEE